MVQRDDIVSYCNNRLLSAIYKDYGPNGLQVAGCSEISRLAVAVSTSQRTLHAAVEWGADGLLVHHGLLWGNQTGPLIGVLGERLRIIFKHDLNLIAYHLPLDGHAIIGNNAQLCNELGFQIADRFAEAGTQMIGVIGELEGGISLGELITLVSNSLADSPTVVGVVEDHRLVFRLGIVSGSGYGTIAEAVGEGCQALLTGDIREPTMAEARESGITVIAAGHEATERLGVQALASELKSQFDIQTMFIDDPNPI